MRAEEDDVAEVDINMKWHQRNGAYKANLNMLFRTGAIEKPEPKEQQRNEASVKKL